MNLPKAIFCWSGGKDSSYALHKTLLEKKFDVCYLLTTINKKFGRISMHGIREELLDLQVLSIKGGIPLLKVFVNEATNSEYEQQMKITLLKAKEEGITHVVFGDIFLEDLRIYRERNLASIGMQGIFPLWKLDTLELMHDFIKKGFKTITCCIDDTFLTKTWVGREINQAFIKELPSNVDPCGENGEFHTFCYEGPLFHKRIPFSLGEKVYKPFMMTTESTSKIPSSKKGFWFCDLVPL